MYWKICEICKKTFKMEGEVCPQCQKDVFRCVLCDIIIKVKKNGKKICAKCSQNNPCLCPVCLEVRPDDNFYKKHKVCKRCAKLTFFIYPEYHESIRVKIDNTACKQKLLHEILQNKTLREMSECLNIGKGRLYGWLYHKQNIDISLEKIKKAFDI